MMLDFVVVVCLGGDSGQGSKHGHSFSHFDAILELELRISTSFLNLGTIFGFRSKFSEFHV